VAEWAADPERIVKERPVVSAGQYGQNLNKLGFTVDAATGQVTAKTQSIVALPGSFPVDTATQAIVDAANTAAGPLGSKVLGEIEGPFYKAKFDNGTSDNRGGESTLGNLVAEVQRWATSSQIAFMNPGGLRADMVGTVTADGRNLTYKQAADVQSFANTLVKMDMTGETIRKLLEQQWQNNPNGSVPARPFLKLGVSEGFEYTYDPTLPEDSRITGMWLNGEPIVADQVYSVAANSFLATGTGDNFFAFADATNKRDSGQVDLQAMVDYMAEFANAEAGDPALPVDYAQRAVGVAFPAGAPEAYAPGETVEFDLSSLSMSAPTDKRDEQVIVSLDGQELGRFGVTSAFLPAADGNSNDEVGKASVSVVLPGDVAEGEAVLTVTGATTGTSATVAIPVASGELPTSTVSATADRFVYGRAGSVDVTVDPTDATGTVQVFNGEQLLGEQTLTGGAATVAVPARTLRPGSHTLRVVYTGDEQYQGSETELTVEVSKARPVMTVKTSPRTIERRTTRPVFDVALGEVGFPVAGKVTVTRGGESWSRRLEGGKASFSLPTVPFAGEKTYQVTYLGNADAESVTKRVTITVVR
jgi:5'-nucleotidase